MDQNYLNKNPKFDINSDINYKNLVKEYGNPKNKKSEKNILSEYYI